MIGPGEYNSYESKYILNGCSKYIFVNDFFFSIIPCQY